MARWNVLRCATAAQFFNVNVMCGCRAQKQICKSFFPPHTISVECTLAQHEIGCGK